MPRFFFGLDSISVVTIYSFRWLLPPATAADGACTTAATRFCRLCFRRFRFRPIGLDSCLFLCLFRIFFTNGTSTNEPAPSVAGDD